LNSIVFYEKISFMMKIYPEYISRPAYEDRLRPLIGSPRIKVLLGQRGAGKTRLLYRLIREIRAGDTKAPVLYIDTEAPEYRFLKTGEDLWGFVRARLRTGRLNYVFIDEIQEIPGFENGLAGLSAGNRCDIYLAGSNARLVSGEFETIFEGKYVKIQVYPLGYGEFLRFYHRDNTDKALEWYLVTGGMPGLAFFPRDTFLIREYLTHIYESVLLRDVAAWEKIRHIRFFESIVACLADTMGTVLSASTISGYLKSRGLGIPVQTVINYREALKKSFLVYPLRRFDLKNHRVLETGEKYYFGDPGLWNMVCQKPPPPGDARTVAYGVYLSLLRQGYTLFAGKNGEGETGFIAEKSGERRYVRPVGRLLGGPVPARETEGLEKIPDNFPKYVVYPNGDAASVNPRGIRLMPLREFLLMNETGPGLV
jgi:predicted AAA+ superfamily ATPase